MKRGKTAAALTVSAWLFTVLQMALSSRWAIGPAIPNFLLVLAAAWSPFLNRSQGALLGFAIGTLNGAVVGANLSQYVVSRTLTSFLAAWANDIRFAPSLPTLFATGFFSTVFANLAMMFLAPPPGIGAYLGATILSAVYNGVLVWPVYALLKRILDPVYR